MRNRAARARALVTDPKLILFDEPTTAPAPISKNAVHAMITRYQREFGFTAVIVSHDIPDVFHVAQKIAMPPVTGVGRSCALRPPGASTCPSRRPTRHISHVSGNASANPTATNVRQITVMRLGDLLGWPCYPADRVSSRAWPGTLRH
jgi:hypothetical protein